QAQGTVQSARGMRRASPFFEKMIIDFMLIYIDRTGNLDLALGWAGSRHSRHTARERDAISGIRAVRAAVSIREVSHDVHHGRRACPRGCLRERGGGAAGRYCAGRLPELPGRGWG